MKFNEIENIFSLALFANIYVAFLPQLRTQQSSKDVALGPDFLSTVSGKFSVLICT